MARNGTSGRVSGVQFFFDLIDKHLMTKHMLQLIVVLLEFLGASDQDFKDGFELRHGKLDVKRGFVNTNSGNQRLGDKGGNWFGDGL